MSHTQSYISKPLNSLADLVQWKYDVPELMTVPLQKSNSYWDDQGYLHTDSHIPQILYCHDMAGGYLESDKTTDFTPVFPAFRFIRWHLIDIFVYFSHHFITIPPISWINLAHRQGVRVYGTLIIECSGNHAFQTVFVNPLETEASATTTTTVSTGNSDETHMNFQELAYRLNEIRRLIGFEGWLINFEVRLPQNDLDPARQRICKFLRLLKSLGSELVWYDAVTWSGYLSYQNCLTDANKPFFDACHDGLFTNYCWDSELLRLTQDNAISASMSSRVFVGVDCFGRGCPGNGGFGTATALQMILDAVKSNPTRPLSVALFAPGWIYERNKPHDTESNPPGAFVQLSKLDWKFWSLLEPLLGQLRGLACSKNRLDRPSIPMLPLVSNGFCSRLELGLLMETNCCSGQGVFRDRVNEDVTQIGSCMSWQQIVPTCRDLSPNCETPNYEVFHWINEDCQPQRSTCLRIALIGSAATSTSTLSTTTTTTEDDSIFMELFSFGPNVEFSKEAYLSLLIRSEDNSEQQLLTNFRLFADRGTGSKKADRFIFDSAQGKVIQDGDKSWYRMECKLSSGDPTIRVGLKWPRIDFGSDFLIGRFEIWDPKWPLPHWPNA